MIDNIKSLYKTLPKGKFDFQAKVAEHFGISPGTVKNNWFSSHWLIPVEKQPKVLEMLNAEHEILKATV